jgi:hypothetical protein
MPCGGIYPLLPDHDFAKMHDNAVVEHHCFDCGQPIKPEDLMFCDEWDCYLHRACVMSFLDTPEGEVVILHGHEVILYLEGEDKTIKKDE